MDWKHPAIYICIGLVVGMAPPLIALHFLQDYQPASDTASHQTRQARSVNKEDSMQSDYFKMFDKPNPRHPSSSDHRGTQNKHQRHRGSRDSLDVLSSIRTLGFTKKLFVAILSEESRVNKMSAAVRMTWGSDVIDFQFMYATKEEGAPAPKTKKQSSHQGVPIHVNKAYGKEHILQSVMHTCQNMEEDYRWYMVTMDTMYINTESTLAFLDTLYHADSILLGNEVEGMCSVDQGIILSKHAHQRVCQNLKKCSEDATIGECLKVATETKCKDLWKASGTVYMDKEDIKNMAFVKLDKKTLFYPNMETPQDLYNLHLQAINVKISETTQKLSLLRNSLGWEETTKTPEQPTASLKDWGEKLDQSKLNATRPSHQMIEASGDLVRSNCQHSNTRDSMPYRTAQLYADDIVEAAEKDLMTFGYRRDVTAFEMVHEFYYTSPKMGRQHVSYVTVSQNYSVLNMLSSEVYNVGNISMVTTVSTAEDARVLYSYLSNLNKACSNLSAFQIVCELFVLINESESVNVSKVKNVVNSFISDQDGQDQMVLRIKLNYLTLNDSMDTLVLGDIAPGFVIAHTSVHSRFNHEYLLRCHINSKSLNTIYYPVPFQIYESESGQSKQFSASDGYWSSGDYRAYCVSQETLAKLSLDLSDIKNGVSDGDMHVNRFPDPGLSIASSYIM